MRSNLKDSTVPELEDSALEATEGENESLLSSLMETSPLDFVMRSLYPDEKSPSEIIKKVSNLIRLKTSQREGDLLESLLSAASKIPPGISWLDDPLFLQTLAELQRHKIEARLNPQYKTICVYFPDGAYREQTGNILTKLKKNKHNTLTLVGTLCGDSHERKKSVYYGGHGIIKLMDFIDCVICPTFAHDLPANATKVYFMHDIHDSPVSKEENVLKMILEYDYYFAPSVSVLKRVKKQIRQAATEGYQNNEKEIGLIPGGYIKLDQNLKLFEKHKKKEKVLIHAPTVMDADIEQFACLPGHSETIIDALLENFPDYKIIFRPHPHTRHSPPAKRISDKHCGNSRFIFDTHASFYMKNYARSALMVTDFSGTAFTYAFTTLRPVVFFSHNESAFKNCFKEFHFVQDRNKVGEVVQNTDQMVKSIRSLLKEQSGYKTQIKKYRDSLIYNLGISEDYFVKNIDYILNQKKHNDWEYVHIQLPPPQLIEEDYGGFNIVSFNGKHFGLARELGNINLEKANLSELDLNFKLFVGASPSEVKGHIDWLNESKTLIAESQSQNLEIERLKNIILTREGNEAALLKDLEEKVDLLEQLMAEMNTLDQRITTLTREREENHKTSETLKQEITQCNEKIKTLQAEADQNRLTTQSLSESNDDLSTQIKALQQQIEEKDSRISSLTQKAEDNAIKIETLETEIGRKSSQMEDISKDLNQRENWIQHLQEQHKALANKNAELSRELERIQASFWYRWIK